MKRGMHKCTRTGSSVIVRVPVFMPMVYTDKVQYSSDTFYHSCLHMVYTNKVHYSSDTF